MYSRLGNVQMPPPDQKTKAWTQADWDRHEEWLKVRAQPKKEFKIVPEVILDKIFFQLKNFLKFLRNQSKFPWKI